MAAETRIPIERIEDDGRITEGTARMRGVTIDDFRSKNGAPLSLPAGAKFVILLDMVTTESKP